MGILRFLSSSSGRWVRVLAGIVLIVTGVIASGWYLILAALGAVFVLVGAFDVCLLAPLFGKPLGGKEFRASDRR